MKNYSHPLKVIIFIFILALANTSCASGALNKQTTPLLQLTIQSSLMFRGWNTRNYSEKKPHDLITVIAMPDLAGDIIILRWNSTKTQFQSELYHQEDSGILKSWASATSGIQKSIIQQPSGTLFVFERISGADGGEKVEVISLK